MRIWTLRYLIGAVAAIVATGCSWEPLEPPGAVPAERVFLMYDNINDDTTRPFTGNVEAAGAAVAAGALGPDERVVVFQRRYYASSEGEMRSVIYELVKDSSQSGGFRREMLRVYGAGVNDALSREVMEAVVADVRTAVPAAHYGFAFGSHGKGWIPKSSRVQLSRMLRGGETHPFAELLTVPENPLTRFFRGYGQDLDVSEFVDALDGWEWDFILLDDCFMASVEALYEMRTLADYVICSPTEILMEGFPYDRVVKTVFGDWSEEGFKEVGRGFVDYYRGQSSVSFRSATVAVVKMVALGGLADAVRALRLKTGELASVDGIQYYEGITRPGHVFFDLDDYIQRIRGATDPTGYNTFAAQMKRTVVYADHTQSFLSNVGLSGYYDVTHYSGLSVFIPWSGLAAVIPDYQTTAWYRDVYAE